DRRLAGFHPRDVVGERYGLRAACFVRRAEPQQPRDALSIGRVLDRAFLQDAAELGPERRVLLGLLLGEILEKAQDALGGCGANLRDVRRMLQLLARDIERQVARIDDAADESEMRRQELFSRVTNEHPADVQLQPVTMLAVPEVVRR